MIPPMNRWAIVIRPLRGLEGMASRGLGQLNPARTDSDRLSPRSGRSKIAQQFIAG